MNKSMWNIYDDLNYKISKNKYCEQYSLFGTIPLLKCVYNNNIKKYYLFNFIHIFTKKIKF